MCQHPCQTQHQLTVCKGGLWRLGVCWWELSRIISDQDFTLETMYPFRLALWQASKSEFFEEFFILQLALKYWTLGCCCDFGIWPKGWLIILQYCLYFICAWTFVPFVQQTRLGIAPNWNVGFCPRSFELFVGGWWVFSSCRSVSWLMQLQLC